MKTNMEKFYYASLYDDVFITLCAGFTPDMVVGLGNFSAPNAPRLHWRGLA